MTLQYPRVSPSLALLPCAGARGDCGYWMNSFWTCWSTNGVALSRWRTEMKRKKNVCPRGSRKRRKGLELERVENGVSCCCKVVQQKLSCGESVRDVSQREICHPNSQSQTPNAPPNSFNKNQFTPELLPGCDWAVWLEHNPKRRESGVWSFDQLLKENYTGRLRTENVTCQ